MARTQRRHLRVVASNESSLAKFNAATRTGYRFTDKDPVIDLVMGLAKADGATLHSIARRSSIAPATLYAWDHGKTKRPQNSTIDFVLRALGYTRAIVKL